jgi:hypothetical protein
VINGRINGKNARTWSTPSGDFILSFTDVPTGQDLTLRVTAGSPPNVETVDVLDIDVVPYPP